MTVNLDWAEFERTPREGVVRSVVSGRSLPPDVVVSAVAAPYTSFRDDAVTPLPLDYQPLAAFIERWPTYLSALGQRLAPGNGYCDIAADEADAAVGGLTSPHVIVRRHAMTVLGRRRLGLTVRPA